MTEWIYIQRKTHCYLTPFIEVMGKIFANSAKKVWFGKTLENFFVIYEKGVLIWYVKKNVMNNVFKHVSSNVIKKPDYIYDVYHEFKTRVEMLIDFSEEINKAYLSRLDGRELWELYKKYIKLYENAAIYGEPLPLATKDFVFKHIKNRLLGIVADKKKVNELLSILTTPTKRSFIKREEEKLLQIGIIIQKDKQLNKIFLKYPASQITNNLKNNYPNIFRLISAHKDEFCWIPYDYGVQLWDLQHFISSLKNLVLNKNCKKELMKLKKDAINLKNKQKALIKKYNIPERMKDLFEYVKFATYIMDYKKEIFTKSHYLVIPMIDELAKRFKTNNILVRFMSHNEINDALLNKRYIQEDELKQRYILSVCFWDREGNPRFLEHQKVNDFIKDSIKENPLAQDKILKGTCACTGKYKGRIKIVMSALDIKKVNKGDILIAPMTSPDYIIGMKKAGAIVTDEGGITCHAAIVSRELSIPCIVGTRIATKILKDNDFIEVDANNGLIKVLARKK